MVRPIILTAGFIERKVRNMVGGGGGSGMLLAFFLLSDLSHYEQDAFGLYLSSFTLEAHCKSLVDLGAWDCIQFPLYVIVGEKSAVARDCKLMESKLTGFPAAALRLYFGGKGGVFYFPLKLVNKCWPSEIVYINNNDPPLPPSPNLIDKILLILGRATWRNSSLG